MKFTATFPDGEVGTRHSDSDYTHASRRDGRIRFHQSRGAAVRAAGAFGDVTEVDNPRPIQDAAVEVQTWRIHRADGSHIEIGIPKGANPVFVVSENNGVRAEVVR